MFKCTGLYRVLCRVLLFLCFRCVLAVETGDVWLADGQKQMDANNDRVRRCLERPFSFAGASLGSYSGRVGFRDPRKLTMSALHSGRQRCHVGRLEQPRPRFWGKPRA